MSVQRKPVPMMKRYLVPNRLADLAARPGGIWKSEAIIAMERNLEAIRATSMVALSGMIAEVCGPAPDAGDFDRHCAWLEKLGNQIITLSGTFGHEHLSDAAKRLCDLVSVMRARGGMLPSPLSVHLGAIRLFAPHNPRLADTSAAMVLDELKKVLVHLQFEQRAEPSLD